MNEYWSVRARGTLTPVKFWLSNISLYVREEQYKMFERFVRPTEKTTVLDVGATSDETLKDANFFDKRYPFPSNLTIATVEDQRSLAKLYPRSNLIRVIPDKKLPFADKQFDTAVSWATLEHVGDLSKQRYFVHELFRVARKVFLTTPYRGCPYEPHTGWLFLHWFSDRKFYWFCQKFGQSFWTKETLHPLWKKDLLILSPRWARKRILVTRIFAIIPSHLILQLE